MNFVIYAIPAFLLLILLEIYLDWRYQRHTYRFNDAINSLNLGMMSQVTGIAQKTVQFSAYLLVFDHIALWNLGRDSWWIWPFAFIAYDFCYYWFHRVSHEINLFWAGHVVHHQSEEYNLSTALRQSSGTFLGFLFYLPMALIGIEPYVLVTVGSLNLIYQFWVHTRHIHQMPAWYETIFVTPSNHRVHHAQNPIYMNKNHGGVFIVWDRLFGTFQPELEQEPVIFGVTKPLASWNPVWANLDVYWSLAKDSWRTEKWADKLKVWFKKTGWRPADVRKAYPNKRFDPYQQVKFDSPLSTRQKLYVALQHLTLIALVLQFILASATMSHSGILQGAALLVFTLFCQGYYQQQRSYLLVLETGKNLLLTALYYLYQGPDSAPYLLLWLLLASLLLVMSQSQKNKTIKQHHDRGDYESQQQ